jgi:hypothetical protein
VQRRFASSLSVKSRLSYSLWASCRTSATVAWRGRLWLQSGAAACGAASPFASRYNVMTLDFRSRSKSDNGKESREDQSATIRCI